MQKSTIEFKEVKITYFTEGEANEAVVFLHGDGQNHSVGIPYLKIFSASFKKITLDLPGHGYSGDYKNRTLENEAELISKILEREKISSSIIIGHSHGASIAVVLTKKIPIKSLILFDPLFASPEISFGKKLVDSLKEHYLTKIKDEYNPSKEYHNFGEEKTEEEIFLTSIKNTKFETLKQNLEVHKNYNMIKEIKSFNKPVLIFQSDNKSPISSKEHVLEIEKTIPKATVEIIKDSTHNMTILKKELIISKLKNYFDFLKV